MRLTFFGPPGSGKGTQALRVSERFGLSHISTGMMFRDEINEGSELGRRVRETVEAGHLVDDATVNAELFGKLMGMRRFLLDGYPRSGSQAESLDRFLEGEALKLTGAVFIRVPDPEVIRRLSGRLVCPTCGFTATDIMFSRMDPCTRCSTPLLERDDDRSEVIAWRLRHYHDLTGPLQDFYRNRIAVIDGMGSVDEVTERILEALAAWA
jgi:adenylate kinase